MATRALIGINVATLALLVLATSAGAADGGSGRFPYLGKVTGTDVYVRCGYGEPDGQNNFYPCTKISAPAKVRVVAERAGWLQIDPVAGCFSVVSKQYVRLGTSGKTGTITTDDVRIRAGGGLRESNFLTEHQRLDKGDKVIVLGSITDRFGGWYKIAPPAGAYYWIYGKYVQPVGADVAEDETEPAPPAEPAEDKEEKDEKPQPVPTTKPAGQDQVLLEQIQQLEETLQGEYDKPLAQRKYQALLAAYKALPVPADSLLAPRVEARVMSLQDAIRQRSELQRIQSIIADTMAEQRQMEMSRTRRQVEAQVESRQGKFAAEGVLTPSEIFTGDPASPKRYLLREPGSRRIVAYVQATEVEADLAQYAGKTVGVYGTARYSQGLALEIIEAISVVVLDEQPTPTTMPVPVIKMPPPPATQPAADGEVPAEPAAQPAAAAEPVIVEPAPLEAETPEPATQPAEPSDDATTTAPADDEATGLPPTGLPMVSSTVGPLTGGIDETEYE